MEAGVHIGSVIKHRFTDNWIANAVARIDGDFHGIGPALIIAGRIIRIGVEELAALMGDCANRIGDPGGSRRPHPTLAPPPQAEYSLQDMCPDQDRAERTRR